jgi:hypothetical protein
MNIRVKILLIGSLFLTAWVCQAQTTRFSKRYLMGGDPVNNLYVLDSGYVVINSDNRRLGPDSLYLMIMKVDNNGVLVDSASYKLAFFEVQGTAERISGPYINMVITESFDTDSTQLKFLRIRHRDLSLVKSKIYRSHVGLGGPLVRDMVRDTDSTWVLTGSYERNDSSVQTLTNEKSDLWIARFDTAFNLIWENKVQDNHPTQAYGPLGDNVIADAYGGYLVTGSFLRGPPRTFIKPLIAARFNETGKLLWYKEYQVSPKMAYELRAVDNGDGTYQYVANYTVALNSQRQPRWNKLVIGQLDTSGNLLSQKLIGQDNKTIRAFDINHTLDGNYYVSGFTGHGNYLYNDDGFGFKFNRSLDSLWFRRYYHGNTEDMSSIDYSYPTEDSGYVHVGFYIDFTNPPNDNHINNWILKTDKFGCVEAGCQNISISEMRKGKEFTVYPSPADINLYLDANEPLKSYYLMGVDGKIHINGPVEGGPINVAGLSAGLYVLKVSTISGKVFHRKVQIK